MTRKRDPGQRLDFGSLTPCPECGGTRWQRWCFVWPLHKTEESGEWGPACSHDVMGTPMQARIDFATWWAEVMDAVHGFDICAGCGLVIR